MHKTSAGDSSKLPRDLYRHEQGKGTAGPSSQRTQSSRGAMPRSRLHRETSIFSQLDFLAAEVSNQPGVHKENKCAQWQGMTRNPRIYMLDAWTSLRIITSATLK